ncbi:hypothetical protein EDB89DRAFT_575107 [Lactarius sanguifluus]|nr:hypothetical protein EDB89DRAFT_575107 [Lactarius sanguifluus]
MKVCRAPTPLEFKHPISTNTAGLFKALANSNRSSKGLSNNASIAGEVEDRRTRRAVRSQLGSCEIFEHASRPSLDDLHVLTHGKLITDPGRCLVPAPAGATSAGARPPRFPPCDERRPLVVHRTSRTKHDGDKCGFAGAAVQCKPKGTSCRSASPRPRRNGTNCTPRWTRLTFVCPRCTPKKRSRLLSFRSPVSASTAASLSREAKPARISRTIGSTSGAPTSNSPRSSRRSRRTSRSSRTRGCHTSRWRTARRSPSQCPAKVQRFAPVVDLVDN